jgi:hypothetical protein
MTRALVEECERLGHALVEVADTGEPGRVNRTLVNALASHGLFDSLFAEANVTATDLCAIRQGLARVCTEATSPGPPRLGNGSSRRFAGEAW